MKRILRLFRYDWPLHFVLMAMSWLPDNVAILRLRGFMAHFFLGACGKKFSLGRNVTFINPANIFIGDDVYIAFGCWILGLDKISIEDQVMLAPYVVLATGDHSSVNGSYRFGSHILGPISIGHGSWIAPHCTVIRNVVIGRNVVVSANSLVNKSIESDCVIGGVPAKVIR